MSRRPIYLVDAFSDRPFAGNPAAVLLDGADLDSPSLQRIAAELRHSETAFPLPATEPQSAFHLRWFSPAAEVGFCGHATLATFHVLVEEAKRIRVPDQGVTKLSFTCKAGRLHAELSRDPQRRLQVRFQTPACKFEPRPVEQELLATLGLVPEAVDPNLMPHVNPRPASDAKNLFIALRERSGLARARPDFKALAELCKERKLGGVCLYAFAPEAGVDAQLRYFAPHFGVDEDPVTGSACGALATLIQEKLPEELPRQFVFAQGKEVGRPGRVSVELRPELEPGEVRAWVGGSATVVVRGELELGKR